LEEKENISIMWLILSAETALQISSEKYLRKKNTLSALLIIDVNLIVGEKIISRLLFARQITEKIQGDEDKK
jgi:hypothetical protein